MDNFQIGDKVIYNPVGVNKPDIERPRDHGIVVGKKYNTHLVIYFQHWNDYSDICYESISHLNKIKIIIIPHGSIDIITYEKLKDGDIIIDFLRTDTKYESEFNTYYLESTFNTLTKNQFTYKPIDKSSIQKYTVRCQN